jgi:hypothetical protein
MTAVIVVALVATSAVRMSRLASLLGVHSPMVPARYESP